MSHPLKETIRSLERAASAPCVSNKTSVILIEECEHLKNILSKLAEGRARGNIRHGKTETHVPGHAEDCQCTGCKSTRYFGSSDPQDHNATCTCSICADAFAEERDDGIVTLHGEYDVEQDSPMLPMSFFEKGHGK